MLHEISSFGKKHLISASMGAGNLMANFWILLDCRMPYARKLHFDDSVAPIPNTESEVLCVSSLQLRNKAPFSTQVRGEACFHT